MRGVLLLGVGQLVYHVREDEQTLVYVGCFLGVLLVHQALAAREVDQVEDCPGLGVAVAYFLDGGWVTIWKMVWEREEWSWHFFSA